FALRAWRAPWRPGVSRSPGPGLFVGSMEPRTMDRTRRRAVAFAIVAALLAWCDGARADIIVVPDEHPTIQEAVSRAHPGDTVRVKPGTYAEGVVIAGAGRDGVTLEALDGRPRIEPPAGRDGIRVHRARRVTIRGLDVSGGRVGVHVLDA